MIVAFARALVERAADWQFDEPAPALGKADAFGEIHNGHRWDSQPKVRFAIDSSLEGAGIEPSVSGERETKGIQGFVPAR
jgi:hypothetical protein